MTRNLQNLPKIPHPHLDEDEKVIVFKGIKKLTFHLFKLSVISSLLIINHTHVAHAANITAQSTIQRVNEIRLEYALPALKENHLLTLAAYQKAQDMQKNKYFAHESPNNTKFYEWIENVDYEFQYAGENLAKNFVNEDKLMKAWLNSPTHKANIIDKDFCEIGMAVISPPESGTLIVQMFGCRTPNTYTDATNNLQNETGYSLQNEDPTEVITTQGENTTNLTHTPASSDPAYANRLKTSSLVMLSAAALLTIGQRRRHYFHIYKIPIKIEDKTASQKK